MPIKNNRQSIYFFQTGDFPEGNGANSRFKIITSALSKQGYDVHLNYLWSSSFNNNKVNSKRKGIYNKVNFRYCSMFLSRPNSMLGKFIDTLYAYICSSLIIIKHIRNIDVFYLYNPTFFYTFHIIALAKLAGKSIIFEKTELFSTIESVKPLKKWDWRVLAKYILKLSYKIDETYPHLLCDHVIAISENLYNFYKAKLGEARMTLIPILVDTNKITPKQINTPPTYTIGYLGSFGYKDGVPGLINAFSIARETNNKLKLRLIGFADNLKSLKKLIKSFNVENSVEIVGQTNSNSIATELYKCDLLVCNRINNKYANYGSPTKVAEYLATGIPTFITNVGDMKNYLTNKDAVILKPENPELLANAIIDRFSSYEHYNQMGLNGLKKAENHFTIEKNLDKLLAVINNRPIQNTSTQTIEKQELAEFI